ncbi:hypothetical protein DFJ73DRAFT_757759 [Zopfochytrium polystomum]|nr:hypothetical protein DFJ73DRAFT_757759 [Zopfochytrium polystomum]
MQNHCNQATLQQWAEVAADGTVSFVDTGKTDDYNSLVTGLFLIGCVVGAGSFMFIVDPLGRKSSVIIGGFLFAVGGALQAGANGLALLLIGRLFSGLANNSAQSAAGRRHLRVPLHRQLRLHLRPRRVVDQVEIFPLRVRAKGADISTKSNWSWNAVIAFAWPKVFARMDRAPSAYWIFSAFCALAVAVWTYFAVPETKGGD